MRSHARDAVVSTQVDPRFPVIPVRSIANDASQEFAQTQVNTIKDYKDGKLSLSEAQLKIEHYWAGALRRAVVDGDVKTGSLMAGQSVGMVKAIEPTQKIIDDLLEQTENFLRASLITKED